MDDSRIVNEMAKLSELESAMRASQKTLGMKDVRQASNAKPTIPNQTLVQRLERFSKSMIDYMMVDFFVNIEPYIVNFSLIQVEFKYIQLTHGFYLRFSQHDQQMVVVDVADIDSVFATYDSMEYIKKHYSQEVRMKNWKEHQQLAIRELKRLKPLSLSEVQQTNTSDREPEVITTLNAIIEDLKKTNRLTVKGFIDVKASLDEMDAVMKGASGESDRVKKAEKEIVQKTRLLFEVFDVIDLACDAATRMNDKTAQDLLQQCVQKSLLLLKEYGIEELPVLHQKIDGETMESIGTVSQSDVHGQLPQYHVYKVHSRAFISTHDKKLLRRAKIISVL